MKIVGRGEDTMIESSDAEKLERMQKNLRKANRSAYQRKKEAGMIRINFWIPGELNEQFDEVAAAEPNNKEDLMIQAIKEFCDRKILLSKVKEPVNHPVNGKSIYEICPECEGFGCDHCDEGWVTKSG
jgi:hypothetical protein